MWEKFEFNENLTGLEDMDLAKRIQQDSYKVGYCSKSSVYHIYMMKHGNSCDIGMKENPTH